MLTAIDKTLCCQTLLTFEFSLLFAMTIDQVELKDRLHRSRLSLIKIYTYSLDSSFRKNFG